MKFLHIADLHLGKSLLDFDLIDDQRFMLNKILSLAKEEKADAIVIAGDVYDKRIPSEDAVNLLDEFLTNIAKTDIKAYIISGNHDSDERLNFGKNFFENHNIYISSVFNRVLEKQVFTDKFGDVNIYMLPFVKASFVKDFYPDENIENYDDAVKTVIKSANIDKSKRNILLAHQFVVGRSSETLCDGSESMSTLNVGNVEKINSDCFDDFDYVALGHIHKPQSVGREEIRYSGSILKYSVSEINSEKSVPIITLSEKGKVDIKFEKIAPKHDLRHIKGELKTLLSKENVINKDDYIYVTLTDEDVIDDAILVVRQTYKNCIKLDYDNSKMKAVEQIDISKIEQYKSFDEIIKDFYMQIYGNEIDDEKMKILKEIAKEAGVINEA